MAKNKRHIDLELKAKLGTHAVPVTESDWTAFETFRNKREGKRRRFIYLIAACLVFVGVMGMLVWKFQDTKTLSGTEKPENVQLPPTTDDKTGPAEKSETLTVDPSEEKHKTLPESESGKPQWKSNSTETTSPESNAPGTTPFKTPASPEGGENPQQKQGVTDGLMTEGPGGIDIQRFQTLRLVSITPFVFYIAAPALNQTSIPAVVAYEKAENKDTGKALAGFKPKSIGIPFTPSLALGLVYGFGKPEMMLGDIDSARTHRQYENTLKEAKQSSQVFRLNLQYEYRLKFGVEFGAGLQFSSVTQVQKYSFQMRDIPYIDTDGTILFYIPIPPNQTVTPTAFESKQNIFSASVPMSVGYAHNLGKSFRLGARAQGSFGMNWSKDFTGLSPSTLSETSLKANVNPLNMSYGGGLFGEYFYLRTWSARVSLDWTAQNKLYKQSNSYNAINRYYEFKLALVRYL